MRLREIWKVICNFETHEVSNTGLVRNIKTNYILKQCLNRQGYHQVYLRNKNGKFTLRVHRLVAIAFIENPYNKSEVNHKDCNKSNNSISNLEWATPKENSIHSALNGRLPDTRGSNNGNSKLTSDQVRQIKLLIKKSLSPTKIYKLYRQYCSRSTIYAIKDNRVWRHINV